MTNDDLNEVLSRLRISEERAREAEESGAKAAEFGKILLEKVQQLKEALDNVTQESHELKLKLNIKSAEEISWHEELEHLRETLANHQTQDKETKILEKDLEEARVRLGQGQGRERRLEERCQLLESQLEEALNATVANAFNSSRLNNENSFGESEMLLQQLQAEQVEWIKEKQILENGNLEWKEKMEQANEMLKQEKIKNHQLTEELEEKECEVSSYSKKMNELREEIQELQVEIEQMKVGQSDPNLKGNSLFSEVEDRRHLVESQMGAMKSKYESMKVQLELKNQQLRKVKMNHISLLNMTNRAGDGDQIKRLEDLLLAEKNKTRMLSDRISLLEKEPKNARFISSPSSYRNCDVSIINNDDGEDSFTTFKASRDNAGLLALLHEERNQVSDLKKQLQIQMRQNLDDSDKMMDLSRKMKAMQGDLSKAKAETYHLKMRLEEAKEANQNSGQKPQHNKKSSSKPNFEDIKFGHKKKSNEENVDPNKAIISCSNDDDVFVEQKELANLAVGGTKKKGVSISDTVQCISSNGEEKSDVLNTNEEKGKMTKVAPKKKFNPVIDASEEEKKMNEQCAQQ